MRPKKELSAWGCLSLFALSAVVAIIYSAWDTPWFQKLVFPRSYWSTQVVLINHFIEIERSEIRDIKLQIQSRSLTRDIDILREINRYKYDGKPLPTEEAAKTVDRETIALSARINEIEGEIDNYVTSLNHARSQLRQHEGERAIK